ncbi:MULTISPECIES: hypothetical protein [Pseudoalteromonas]|uniref:Uncharacterized protein n=1 Tax=Pseudoalteromonas luteoviolacea (strain 2ta16) TaxID=1353533 RepID=V4HUE3_PSEL2|nr:MULTISPECIES: hypothetical protein [Pseudoalteromonas]ESP91539.1 hypothetical protein PL2TA16_00338 [Pseudoalteromonas luteoviolacea 2ta16]KZN40186.1 hypothetical protein N483_18525 [Pseudoalteromonas luteoviolacea NCIMB 1944]MCG7549268.1 hypothetical protein [Pseudoalteromonas sp. Of7M-16]
MYDRSYGILFSEFSDSTKYDDFRFVIPCLEAIRLQLESLSLKSDGVFEFYLVSVCSHSTDNCYPEIGVHTKSGKLSDSDYDLLESIVIKETQSISAESQYSNHSNLAAPSWARLKKLGSYPE